jgi:hypothetical protein
MIGLEPALAATEVGETAARSATGEADHLLAVPLLGAHRREPARICATAFWTSS